MTTGRPHAEPAHDCSARFPGQVITSPGEVLQIGSLPPALETVLAQDYRAAKMLDFIRDPTRAAFAPGARVAVTSGHHGLPGDLMALLPRLEAVVVFGAGYQSVDTSQAIRRGIQISNTPDVLSDCVADTALALVLDVFRRFSDAGNFLRRGDWKYAEYPPTRKISGSTIGVLGLGRIGRAVATRAAAFGATVIYHNRHPVNDSALEYIPSIIELAARSDALIVTASGGPTTTGMVNNEVLSALGNNGYLVNVARGSIVDEAALVEALTAGTIAGAGFDVFENEPAVPASLLSLQNVVLLPHVGSNTQQTRNEMCNLALANLRSFLASGEFVNPVPETTEQSGSRASSARE